MDNLQSLRPWALHLPGNIRFGRGVALQLGEFAQQSGYQRALIVTDRLLVQAGVVETVEESLRTAGISVEVFEGGEPEPSMTAVLACVAQAKSYQPDVLVAVGGGSNMDLAKAAAIVLNHGGHPRDYVGDEQVPGPVFPLVCIPTTAGTGSEVSFASVLKDTEKGCKVGVLSNYLRPKAAFVDPLLTVSCPRKTTADAGMDALTHAIEAYTAVDNNEFPLPEGVRTVYQGRHPFGILLAEKAIHLVGRYLRRAVADGGDLEARDGMSLAALFAGLAFSNIGVALVHAMEYPLGSATPTTHGAGNALLLPHVMRFNLPVRAQEMARIARLLGEDTDGLDTQEAAEIGIRAVEQLGRDVGTPASLRDCGVQERQIPEFADIAFGLKRILRVNPRQPSRSDIEAIFRAAY